MSKRRVKKKYKVMMGAVLALIIIITGVFTIKLINENKPETPQIEYGEIHKTNALEGEN